MQEQDRFVMAADLARAFGQIRRMGVRTGHVQGLRPSELMFLATVDYLNTSDTSEVKASDLCAALHITQAAATHVMRKLEEQGYVQRQSSPRDKRVVLVKPTEAGRALVASTEKKFLDLFMALVEHLGEADSKELIRLLHAVLSFVQTRREKE